MLAVQNRRAVSANTMNMFNNNDNIYFLYSALYMTSQRASHVYNFTFYLVPVP